MDFQTLTRKAKRLVSSRGGPKEMKEDAGELQDVARGEGSWSEKGKAAASAVREPGAPAGDEEAAPRRDPGAPPPGGTQD